MKQADCVEFMVDKLVGGQDFLQVLGFPHFSIIPPMLHAGISLTPHRRYYVLAINSVVK